MIQKAKKLITDSELNVPREFKEFLNPKKGYYHLQTSRCKKGKASIEVGDYVRVGQVIGQRDGGFFKQNIHSTISGTYVGDEKHYYRNGKQVTYMVIENDFKEEYVDSATDLTDDQIFALDKDAIIEKVTENSSVGLGGSGFPAYIKLDTQDKIDMVLLNGAECEPYLNTDYEVMMKRTEDLVKSLNVLLNFYCAKEAVICVKDKHADLIEKINNSIKKLGYPNIRFSPGTDYYPQGYEKDVIKAVTGDVIPNGEMPSKYGYMVFNTTSALTIFDTLRYNLPLISREISLIGKEFNQSMNLQVKVGTHFSEILDFAGGYNNLEEKTKLMVLGGPMMGTAIRSDDLVVTKSLSTFLIQEAVEVEELACVNCASCVYSCPVGLQPVIISRYLNLKDSDALKALDVKSCIECGLCSYVCTSKIDLTKNMRRAKRLV